MCAAKFKVEVARLPGEYQILANAFADLKLEEGQKGVLTEEDFAALAEHCKKSPSGVTGVDVFQCGENSSYSDSFFKDYILNTLRTDPKHTLKFILCPAFNLLRSNLNLPMKQQCNRFSDVEDLLSFLPTMYIAKKPWKDADRFAALENMGTVLLHYATAKKAPTGLQIPQTAPDAEALPKDILGAKVEMVAPVGGSDEAPTLVPVLVTFDVITLLSGTRVVQNIVIKKEDQVVPQKEWGEIMPYILEKTGSWRYRDCGWSLLIAGLILFDHDSPVLNDNAQSYLDLLASTLKSYPDIGLVITGSADSVGDKGRNKNLGIKRANAVKNYVKKKGISDGRLVFNSIGETKPVNSVQDNADDRFNRNVQIRTFSVSANEFAPFYFTQDGVGPTKIKLEECTSKIANAIITR